MLESTECMRHCSGMEGDPLGDVLTLASARCVHIKNANRAGGRAKPFLGAMAASDNVGADGARLATQN